MLRHVHFYMKGGEPSFAAFARALANLKEAAVHMAVEIKNAAFDLMAAESRFR